MIVTTHHAVIFATVAEFDTVLQFANVHCVISALFFLCQRIHAGFDSITVGLSLVHVWRVVFHEILKHLREVT